MNNLKDPDSSQAPRVVVSIKKPLFSILQAKMPILVFLFGLVAIGFPLAVHANLFSILIGNTASAQAPDPTSTAVLNQNSQTIDILEPHLALDPTEDSKDASSTMIDDNALFPLMGPLGSEADVADIPSSTQISTYVVHAGDTISKVAETFNVSAGTILVANGLSKGAPLKEGMTLVILPISGVKHVVGKGDTLGSIAKRYKTDVDEIVRYNDVAINSELAIGDAILIPDVENTVLAEQAPKAPLKSGSYTVGHGTSRNTVALPGYYIWPIAGHAGRMTQGAHGYMKNSVDIAAPRGTNLVAAADGVVIVSTNSGWNGGYGRYMIIAHPNGTKTIYGHMQHAALPVGTQVVQGQVIGQEGATGNATGPHAHFEVRNNGIINPGINNTWKN